MNETVAATTARNDEISLISIARIVVKRIKLFWVTFFLVLTAGIVLAFLNTERYGYVTVFRVAEISSKQYAELPAHVLVSLNASVIPAIREAVGGRLPVQVKASNPEETGLIVLNSEAQVDQKNVVVQIHESIVAELAEASAKRLGERRRDLERQLSLVEDSIAQLKTSGEPNSWAALASAYDKRLSIETALSDLREGEVVAIARKSIESNGINRSVIIAISVVLAVFLAFLSVFLREFSELVKGSQR